MTVDKKHSPRCFIDIEIDGENAGRIIMELFTDVCPITCENFRALCTGEKGIGKTTDQPLHYKDSPFHRVVKNFVIQGGDFVAGNGTGGESIYGGQFKDENFDIPHDKPFLLSMSNRGKDSNGSQFFITTQAAPHLNGKHTVFGQVIHGQEVVSKIENIKTDPSCRPTRDVKISNCGELVLKVRHKEKKRVTTESSDSESEEERLRKKRKHKHSKKHKKEKKEAKESNSSRKEEDSGCMVDPEEIPTIPTNNFLMRRTSPLGDRNRRPPQRESYSYGRPVISRSGRKIKGRGFMRYRTPSRSTSRSGSETPPHWKQAQSRLKNIKDVVLPKRPVFPTEENESQSEDMESGRGNVLHSRLGMSRAAEEQKQKDARTIMRENRRNREWSQEESPPRGDGPLRSTVVVTSNFQKEPEQDRFRRNDWRRGRSPERRDRFADNDRNRRQFAADSRQKPERPQRSQKDITKSLRALAGDFTKYRKEEESEESTDEDTVKNQDDKGKEREVKERVKDREVKGKDSKLEKSQEQSKRLKSLKNDLFRYRKDDMTSDSSEESEKESGTKIPGLDLVGEKKTSEPAKKVYETKKFIPTSTQSKNLKSLTSDLLKYKNRSDDSSSDDSEEASPKKTVHIPFISEENTATSNGIVDSFKDNEPTLPKSISGFGISEVKIPGICEDSNEASMDTDPPVETNIRPVDEHKMIVEESLVKEKPLIKEKRRWDMQETETKKKTHEPIQIVFHTSTLPMPNVIPLPEETIPTKTMDMDVSDSHGMLAVARATRSKTPPIEYGRSRSRSPHQNVRNISPVKTSRHTRNLSKDPDQQHSSSSIIRKETHRSRSPSPKLLSSIKHEPRSPSKSPPPRKKSSPSPETRTKKLRSKSPVTRRARQSKSRSKSPIRARTKSPIRARSKSPIRARTKSPIRARSKSPIRRSRSKSPIRRTRQSPRRGRQSKSPRRGRSKSRSRSRSRDRIRRRRTRSPINVRRRSTSRSRFRRFGGNRSPNRRGSFRYGKSPISRGRVGGRRRTRSRSPIRRRRGRRSSSSSGRSSSSRSSSSRSDRRKRVVKGKRRSSSSSSSSKSKKSDSDSASP